MRFFATQISNNMHETPEGYLVCEAVRIARTGIMQYASGEIPLDAGDDGMIHVSRGEDDIFRAETISSFEGKPFTIRHPEEFVNPENWSDLAKGTIQNVRRGEGDESDNLLCDILITDQFAISLVKSGIRGLSCGYECDYTQTGEGAGLQTNIVGNHLALVQEGRAGKAYAIRDHKGVFTVSKKLADKIKAAFGKAVDEAVAGEPAPKAPAKAKDEEGDLSDIKKLLAELAQKVDKMGGASDEDKPADKEEKPAKDEDKDKDEGKDDDAGDQLEERIKALEMAVQKILEQFGDDDEEDDDDETGDEGDDDKATDEEPEDKSKKKTGDQSAQTSDEASRAEILAPGLKAKSDVKTKALKMCYGTKDGRAVIEQLTGGKVPQFDKPEAVEMLFVAASELMKAKRSKELSKTKTGDFKSSIVVSEGQMTADKMNEINAKHYNKN